MRQALVSLISGVLLIVFGLVLADVVLSQAVASGSSASIGSFSGARALNDIIPLVYYTVIVVSGVGLIGLGALQLRGGRRSKTS
ncbi:MAG: hypothetical protein KatS3mg051_2258 [Anaerolineae bacterium]|nr:MAG: hypothetical protein KatS3mg051_2258 [Anaerolineae bacterium]